MKVGTPLNVCVVCVCVCVMGESSFSFTTLLWRPYSIYPPIHVSRFISQFIPRVGAKVRVKVRIREGYSYIAGFRVRSG